MNIARNDKLLEEVGSRIKKLREKQQLSLDDLGRECDMERNTIHRIEKGKVNTSLSVLDAIAKVLGSSIGELLKDL